MNRRKAVFCLSRRVPSHFNSFRYFFSVFNELSVRLRLVRIDQHWFDASQMPHGTPSLFMPKFMPNATGVLCPLNPFCHRQFLTHRQAAR